MNRRNDSRPRRGCAKKFDGLETVEEIVEDSEVSDTETLVEIEVDLKRPKEQAVAGAVEDDFPFSSPARMKVFVDDKMNEYVFDTVERLIESIMTSKDVKEIPDLAGRLLDLPLDFSNETMIIGKGCVLNVMSRNWGNTFQVVAFLKEVSERRDQPFAIQLRSEFLKFLEKLMLKDTPADVTEQENRRELKRLQKSPELEILKIQKLEKYVEALQTQNLERAIEVARLAIKLYSSGSLSVPRMVRFLKRLTVDLDCTSLKLLVLFMQEIGKELEKDFLNYPKEIIKKLEMTMSDIFSTLETIGDTTYNIGGFPKDLQMQARTIVLRKKAAVCLQKHMKDMEEAARRERVEAILESFLKLDSNVESTSM